MRIGRTLPPAAAPIKLADIISGVRGLVRGEREIRRFEAELTADFNVNHCFLLSSGKAALTIVLKALHRQNPHKNEVIIPAYTCYSVPSAICRAGLKIRLCDIDPATLDFDFNCLEEVLSDKASAVSENRVLAVIPTHLFGVPSDVKRTREITAEHGVLMIEDAAQAMGGELQGQRLGTFGDAGFFSLGRGKAFSTVEGGIILTDNSILAKQIQGAIDNIPDYRLFEILKLFVYSVALNVFMHPAFFWLPKSLPFLKLGETVFEISFPLKKMSSLQAGLARNWQVRLKQLAHARRHGSRLLRAALEINETDEKKKGYKLFQQLEEQETLLRFPVRIVNDELLRQIVLKGNQKGLGIMRGYPDAIHRIDALKEYFKNTSYPGAVHVARTLITLPVHVFVSLGNFKEIMALMINPRQS
ncbi:dTDP-4-amino-4,6-dideoxygalactose transaminase [Desulfocicer vacuolatum DSM 3385]|uniref:dTDP-4-amino-4,6-dideoxygalactose transaminase n=1 Tax=Desulfocicer vacuolatum DSM 3385 TaxID=1121400 RepID=A0A1W1ZQM2_9BACT|nr:DegT/DnrJ/EryC1/StrS family aminotransferase [Desulfocicer vacuolatum]SMC50398.1 dTDP-4-amino-4,6-dideoxygalactose transaminase [Desulfocicer vacuolatum DSM 3385]